jgi:small subunit ribosomal protein S1
MEALLEEESLGYPSLRRGEIIEGVVVGKDREGLLVDIGAKSEGIIPPNEMQSLRPDPAQIPQIGDKVLVYVLQPETAEGQIIVSIDRARGEKGWRLLQRYYEEATSFEGEVTGYNKGGLLVDVEGVQAFVPLSQLVGGRVERPEEAGDRGLATWMGKSLRLKVIEINRRRNRVILSERAAVQEWRAAQKDRLLAELREGDIRRGRITSIREFGIFVDLGGADGLVHLSELSWDRSKAPEDMFRVGDEVDVFILKIDQEAKKIALSLRRAQPEQWEGLIDKYAVGQVVTGQVTKLAPFGAFARIEGPLEGLIHISELVDRRVTHPRDVVSEGDTLPLKIVRIERDRHRLGLSLKQVRPQAEQMGYVFDENGSVIAGPGEEVPTPRPPVMEEIAEAPAAQVEEEEEELSGELRHQLSPALVDELEARVAQEPVAELAAEEPVAEVAEEPAEVAEEPAAELAEAPVAEEAEEPVAEVAEEPVAEVAEEPVAELAEAPVAEVAEESVAEESVAELATEEPVAELAEAPVAEVAEEPAAEVAEEPVAEEPVAEEAEEPVAEVATEELVAEESEEVTGIPEAPSKKSSK